MKNVRDARDVIVVPLVRDETLTSITGRKGTRARQRCPAMYIFFQAGLLLLARQHPRQAKRGDRSRRTEARNECERLRKRVFPIREIRERGKECREATFSAFSLEAPRDPRDSWITPGIIPARKLLALYVGLLYR